MNSRHIMRLELSPAAFRKVGEIADRQGMTQLSMLSRLTIWFAEQPPQIQAAIMGHYPIESDETLALLIMRHMAGHVETLSPTSIPARKR